MPRLNAAERVLSLKAVFYGAPSSGKTTNLSTLHRGLPSADRSELVVVDSDVERTLYFDYFSSELGTLGGLRLRAEFFAVPGQPYYAETRRLILDGVDAVVFVADSDPARMVANRQSLRDLLQQLETFDRSLDDITLVFQYNKRDLEHALPVPTLSAALNPYGAPELEAVAVEGVGVEETAQRLLSDTLARLRSRSGG